MILRFLRRRKHTGFLLLEVLLGTVIFAIFLSGLGLTILYGQENTINGGDRTRGSYISARTMESVRAIRDGSFAAVTTGTHGTAVDPMTGAWVMSGTQVTLTGAYVSSVVVASKGVGWLGFTGSTTWKHGYNRNGAVNLLGEITDWKSANAVGNWGTPSLDGSYIDGGTPLFSDVAVAGNTAYVTNDSVGLYMFDITNTAFPARVGSSFNVGYTANAIAIRGTRMYLLTSDPAAELKVYSITSAASPVLITGYDLPGSALGKSLALGHNLLTVGAVYSATAGQYELYSFDVSNSRSVVLKSQLNDTDTVNAIAVSGSSAYIGSSVDTAEFRVINVISSGSFLLTGGYNLSDRTLNGLSIAVSGTSALLGTEKGASTQEMVMFDIGNGGVPTGGSGPWYHEGSGSIVGIDMDPYRCFAFLGASSGRKAFQVVNMRNKASLPELYSYNSTSGLGRGLSYDLVRDRVYVLTDSAFLIFKPGVSIGTCP